MALRMLSVGIVGSIAAVAVQSAAAPVDPGEAGFKRVCAACHTSLTENTAKPPEDGGATPPSRALPREILRQLPPEAILAALTTGKMQAQGSLLGDQERTAVAEYAAGSRLGAAAYGAASSARPNLCKEPAPVIDQTHAPAWNGWSTEPANRRFQPRSAGGLTAADLPQLKLKWAFGYVGTATLRAQPAVFGHRVFAGSDSGELSALDARTGCTYWVFKAEGSIAAPPSVGPIVDESGKKSFAVYVGDRTATVYALDVQNGELIWKRKVDQHRVAGITGAPLLYAGRLYVPVEGVAEEGVGTTNGYACCTFRGSLSQLDANTGAVLWKTFTVMEPTLRATSPRGVQSFGPSGGGIWAAPTLDVKRGLVYVGTGNGYSDPPQPGTDAIVAMDLKSGVIRWTKQVSGSDTWAMGCAATNTGDPGCPATLGPDYDFSASPVLVRAGGRDLLLAAQKSGQLYALDPERQGEIRWQFRFGQGSGLGGQWGGAVEGDRFFIGTADLLTKTPGGMHALKLADGTPVWSQDPQPKLCLRNPGQACSAGQGGAVTTIPGAVLNAGLDGGLRAYATGDGQLLWLYDTNRDFATVNGVLARGGGMDHGGPVVVGGMLYVNSGYGGFVGHPGNVLLAFGLD